MKIGILAFAAIIAACTQVPPADAEAPANEAGAAANETEVAVNEAEPEVPAKGEGSCDAGKAQSLIGRERSDALGAEALRLTGARTIRWIRPGDVVTMDYREDRLNIHLDSRGRVERIACG